MKPTYSPSLSVLAQQELACQELYLRARVKKLNAILKAVSKYQTRLELDGPALGCDDVNGVQSEGVGLGVQLGSEAAATGQNVYAFDVNTDDYLITVWVVAKSMKEVRAKVKAAFRA